jgi:hypothetical protein
METTANTNRPTTTKNWLKGLAYTIGVGVAGFLMGYLLPNKIPNISDVKKGFVPPSRLEIKVQDVDLDENPEETTLIYKDEQNKKTTYFIKFAEDTIYESGVTTKTLTSRPTIVPFKIEEGK